MSKSIEDMYKELCLDRPGLGDGNSLSGLNYTNSSYSADDDSEEFMTSKEIVKTKEQLEERYGVLPPSTGDGVIEEDVHYKRYSKRREHRYTESELAEIRSSCIASIVHDYSENDVYHISDEERSANDILDEIGMKLSGLKRTYRKVDQYIEAMRIVVQAWEMLESKGNYIHSREEFFQMVSKGRIVSNRIIMPKLKKIDDYNIDMIIKYISNPELDATDLVPDTEPEDDWYNDIMGEGESEEDEMLRLLSPEDFKFIEEHHDSPPTFDVKPISRKLIRGYDRRDFGRSKRNVKKKNKNEKYIAESLHDILNKIQNNEVNRSRASTRSSLITHSMFDVEKPDKDVWDDLYFDGSWANENGVFLYDLAIREELLRQHPTKQKYLTFADEELARFFKILEDNGINTIDLRRKMDIAENGNAVTVEKHQKKENKKIEGALLQRITELNRDPKFKKIVSKAEDAINKQFKQY